MKKVGLICALISFGSITLTACQSSPMTVVNKTHQFYLAEKCPSPLVIKRGETVQITLPENPSTGYQWQVLQTLKLLTVEESYQQQEAEEGMVGVGGEKTFRFKAQRSGQELIELVHIRPWESSKQAEQQWQCKVQIV